MRGMLMRPDPIDGTHFSIEELLAGVEEAEAGNLYALAHACSPRVIKRAVQAGMRQQARIGQLVPGACADLLLVGDDPMQALAPLARPDIGIRLPTQGGRTLRNTLQG